MRILFTMTGSWGTGSGTVVEALAKALTEREHEVCVLYPERAPDGDSDHDRRTEHAPEARHEVWDFPLHRDGTRLYTFPLMLTDPHPRNVRGAWTFKDLSEDELNLYLSSFQQRLIDVVEDFQPDLIECHHIWAQSYVVNEMSLPYVAVAHHSDQMAFHFDDRMRPYATRAARGAEMIFAVSESNRQEVIELYGVPEDRVIVTGNGYDQELFQPKGVNRAALLQEFDLDIPPAAPIVTFAGKMSRTKGIDTLMLANRRIQKEQPVHFIIFGSGELEDVLDDELREAYDFTNTHFLGHRPYETIARFHNISRLSVMPSRSEGFGIAGLEAMGCALPLVITRTGGLDVHAVGEIIEPGDEEALAESILHLINLPNAEYDDLSQRALDAARSFSWAAIAEQRITYYEEVTRRTVER